MNTPTQTEVNITTNLKLFEGNVVLIYVRRWFQKTYGNTYHSIRIYDKNGLITERLFEYGYGNHFEVTAKKALLDLGIDLNSVNIEYDVVDVNRKKDL